MDPVRTAEVRELEQLAGVLARAFVDDPFAEWAIPGDPDVRLEILRAQFRSEHEQVFLPARTVEVAGGGVLAAQAVWAPPGTPPDEPDPRGGHMSAALALIEERHPAEPHWYLAYLGTDPDHRRLGHARALLSVGLARADRDHLPSYLWTAKPGNVAFYERFGFEVAWTDRPGGAPPVWGMRRPSR